MDGRWKRAVRLLEAPVRDLSGGPVARSLPSNVKDTGLIPGQGTGIPYALGSQARMPKLRPYMAK